MVLPQQIFTTGGSDEVWGMTGSDWFVIRSFLPTMQALTIQVSIKQIK